jgi:hypothetical protein
MDRSVEDAIKYAALGEKGVHATAFQSRCEFGAADISANKNAEGEIAAIIAAMEDLDPSERIRENECGWRS